MDVNRDLFVRNAIRVHPAVTNMFDGDFDGDTCHIIIPTSEEAITDLPKMDVLAFITAHPREFNPGKEIKMYKREDWSMDPNTLAMQIDQVKNDSTNGKSISYEDLLDSKKQDSYFQGTKVNREELAHFSRGVSKDEVIGKCPSINGSSTRDAVRAYRMIKGLTPKSGAISNSLMTLAISKTWNWVKDKKLELIQKVAHAKHVLCQDGLSAKHGKNQTATAEVIYGAFYRSAFSKVETREEYKNCLTEFGIPEDDAEAVLEVFWKDPPVNINDQIKEVAPHYALTRRSAKPSSFEDCVEVEKEENLQTQFLSELFKGGEDVPQPAPNA